MVVKESERTYHNFLAKCIETGFLRWHDMQDLLIELKSSRSRIIRKKLRYIFLFKKPMTLLSALKKDSGFTEHQAVMFIETGNIGTSKINGKKV